MFLVSPTEPREIAAIGQTSSVPESLGVDVMWASKHGLCGAQRKTVPDLIASTRDTRLGKELEQMQKLYLKALIVEGRPQWTRDGLLLESHAKWTLKEHRGIMLSAQARGVLVLTSSNHLETLDVILQLKDWSERESHVSSMLYRGNSKGDSWGELTDRATAVYFLSAIPGLGVELAGRFFDHFGVPIRWTITKEQMLEVPGIGKKRAEQIWRMLEGITPVTDVEEVTQETAC